MSRLVFMSSFVYKRPGISLNFRQKATQPILPIMKSFFALSSAFFLSGVAGRTFTVRLPCKLNAVIIQMSRFIGLQCVPIHNLVS